MSLTHEVIQSHKLWLCIIFCLHSEIKKSSSNKSLPLFYSTNYSVSKYNHRKVVIEIDFIYDKIIIPMNQFANRHSKLMFWTPVVISIIALIASIAK